MASRRQARGVRSLAFLRAMEAAGIEPASAAWRDVCPQIDPPKHVWLARGKSNTTLGRAVPSVRHFAYGATALRAVRPEAASTRLPYGSQQRGHWRRPPEADMNPRRIYSARSSCSLSVVLRPAYGQLLLGAAPPMSLRMTLRLSASRFVAQRIAPLIALTSSMAASGSSSRTTCFASCRGGRRRHWRAGLPKGERLLMRCSRRNS